MSWRNARRHKFSWRSLYMWVLVWFLFYGPSTHFKSFRAQWVNLATLFLGKPPGVGNLPVLIAHSLASNWQLLSLNQWKSENGHRNVFMTKSPRKNVPEVGIQLRAACMPSEHASDRATASGLYNIKHCLQTNVGRHYGDTRSSNRAWLI